MIVPTIHAISLLVAILATVCWGSWANTYKLAGDWRFELYGYDFAFGVALAALAAALTLGTLGSELSFSDNFLIAGKLKMAAGVGCGLVLNLAVFLILAAVSVAGMSVAFPISFGVAMVAGGRYGTGIAWIAGLVLVAIAVVMDAIAWASTDRPVRMHGTKGIVLSLAGGLLLAAFFPLASWAQTEDNGLGPYSLILLMAAGVFVSTFVYNIYFLNLPVQGQALRMSDYFRGTSGQHLLGLTGGAIWCVGTLAFLVTESVPTPVQPGRLGNGLFQAAPLVSALWGLLVWKEFRGAGPVTKGLLAGTLLLFACGVVLLT
jgi:glucose uptake protein